MVSFLHISPPKPCMHTSSPQHVACSVHPIHMNKLTDLKMCYKKQEKLQKPGSSKTVYRTFYHILTDTISAMHLLVFPLSSLIVIGLSSFIRSRAAGQSNYAETQNELVPYRESGYIYAWIKTINQHTLDIFFQNTNKIYIQHVQRRKLSTLRPILSPSLRTTESRDFEHNSGQCIFSIYLLCISSQKFLWLETHLLALG